MSDKKFVALVNTKRHALSVSLRRLFTIGVPGTPRSRAYEARSIGWKPGEIVLVEEAVLDEPMVKDLVQSKSLAPQNKGNVSWGQEPPADGEDVKSTSKARNGGSRRRNNNSVAASGGSSGSRSGSGSEDQSSGTNGESSSDAV